MKIAYMGGAVLAYTLDLFMVDLYETSLQNKNCLAGYPTGPLQRNDYSCSSFVYRMFKLRLFGSVLRLLGFRETSLTET